jgi:serine protease
VKPSSTFGASVIGYKIEVSTNKTTWTTAVANTRSTTSSAYVSSGLKIGSPNYFRVRAITKKGSTTKSGSASAAVSKTLTAKPAAPALLGLTKITAASDGIKTARWLPQTASQMGGLKVTYKVVAQAENGTEISCSTSTKAFCSLTGLVPATKYSLKLSAKNSRGSESNIDELLVPDAEFAKQWYLGTENGIAATRAWTATKGSSSVVVAVLDSGITVHPEFIGQLVDGYDFVSDVAKSGDGDGRDLDPSDPGDGVGADFSSWHGTHVAGIIAAKSNETGITGIAPNVKIQPIRVLGSQGEGSSIDLALAIRWAAGQDVNGLVAGSETLSGFPVNKTPAKVINLSMAGLGSCPSSVQAAAEYAMAKGVTLVSAAGNGDDNNNPIDNSRVYPTNCLGPISVGATGFTGDAAFYSNYGVDLSAPGGDQRNSAGAPVGSGGMIYSTSNTGTLAVGESTYKVEQGTSMAAPVVSGIVALMYSLRPKITSNEVWSALKASVQPFPAGSICSTTPGRCGLGAINAATAIEALIGITG